MEAFAAAGLAGTRAHYHELPGVTHFAWDFAYRDGSYFDRVREVKRDPFPARVVYSTFSPRYRKAYWLRIDRIDRGFTLARVEATPESGVFDLKPVNVTALSLLLAPEVAPPGRPIEVRVDGRRVFRGVPRGDVLSLAAVKGARKATAPWTGPAEGPPDHPQAGFRGGTLAQYGRHAYVYGTSGDAATVGASKAGAEMLADWGPNVRARWRVLADAEVTPEIMASHDLVLVGTAATNRVVAGLAVYGGGRPAALERFVPSGRQAPPFSRFADYLVIGEDDKVVLEGYFKDDYRIAP